MSGSRLLCIRYFLIINITVVSNEFQILHIFLVLFPDSVCIPFCKQHCNWSGVFAFPTSSICLLPDMLYFLIGNLAGEIFDTTIIHTVNSRQIYKNQINSTPVYQALLHFIGSVLTLIYCNEGFTLLDLFGVEHHCAYERYNINQSIIIIINKAKLTFHFMTFQAPKHC